MKQRVISALAAFALILGMSAYPAFSQTQGDPDEGADLFDSYCSDCHSVSAKGLNKKGPTLFHVIGRKAGSSPGFQYSAQMQTSGIVWTPERISAYLANPKGIVPQGIMKFKGMPKARDRADVIAYLRNPD